MPYLGRGVWASQGVVNDVTALMKRGLLRRILRRLPLGHRSSKANRRKRGGKRLL